jgi:hypothetical protein
MKLISHLLILAVGAGLGIWWGVNHPTEAQNLAAREQAAVSQAKIDLIQKFMGHGSPDDKNSAEYQQMLKDEQQKLQDAKAKLGS